MIYGEIRVSLNNVMNISSIIRVILENTFAKHKEMEMS